MKRVQSGSPSASAGLRTGDVVVAMTVVGPSEIRFLVTNAADIDTVVGVQEIGRELVFEAARNGEMMKFNLTISDLKSEPERIVIPTDIVRLAGVAVKSLEAGDRMFGIVKGVEVTDVGKQSLAEFLGLRAGDIITAVDQDKIGKPDDLLRLVKERRQKFDLHIVRDQIPLRVQFPV